MVKNMRYIFALLFLIFIGMHSAHAKSVTAIYGIYAGGFNVAEIEATYNVDDKDYSVKADLKTVGVLGSLAPWSGDIQTSGIVQKGTLIPQMHKFANTWRDETKISKFTFNQDGSLKDIKRIYEDGTEKDRTPAKDVLVGKPVDMLTAMLRATQGQTCAGKQPALDAKRRFDMVFTSKGESDLKKNRYSAFEGSAEICEVEIAPVAGKWREKPRGWMNIQDQAKTKGQLPRLWFAHVKENTPKIPVRMVIKTNYGAMVMHLKALK